MTENKFDYHIVQTNERLCKIEEKLDKLLTFRVMLIGASITLSSIVSVGLTLLEIYVLRQH